MRENDFFISHCSETKELARHIYYNAITNGLFPWYDEALLEIGHVLEDEIRRGIEASKAFVLLHCEIAAGKYWVQKEMEFAQERSNRDPSFRIVVVKLDEHPLEDWWMRYLFHQWSMADQPGSVLKLIGAIAGRNGIVQLAAASSLTAVPSQLFGNETGTFAEHSRNYVLYCLAHVKGLLSATARVGYENEVKDTLSKLLNASVFQAVPSLQGGLIPTGPGSFEFIMSNRKRIPPRVTIVGLPDRYKANVTSDEVLARISIVDSQTGQPVTHPVPFTLEFNSEL